MGNVAILIPAAGASSRMRGADKLLELVGDEPLLTRQARIALRSGAKVLITLPPGHAKRRAVLEPLECQRLRIVELSDATEGLAASIRAAAVWAKDRQATGLMILLADMPEIEVDDLRQMIDVFKAAPDRVWRAVSGDGTNGHPVIFPRRLFLALGDLTGDTGARAVLAGETVTSFTLGGGRATTDLDTPEDWAAWRHKTGL